MALNTQKKQYNGSTPKPVPVPKQILLYSISGIFFLIGLFGFMQVSWLFSMPLSENLRAELAQEVKVPEDARGYSTNHGNYIFFTDTPDDNPRKAAVILLMLIGGIGTSISINIYLAIKRRKLKTGAQPTQK